MKYLIPAFVFLHIQACGGDSNPFAPLTDTDPSGSTQQTDSNTMQEPDANPVVMPVPQSDVVTAPQTETINEPIIQPEPINEPDPVIEPEPVEEVTEPVVAVENTPENEIEGIWYCKQFGEYFTWDLKPDRTILLDNPGIFTGVIGTYWHLQGETFALGYTSGGIAEFTCDGKTVDAGEMICSRTPIVDD